MLSDIGYFDPALISSLQIVAFRFSDSLEVINSERIRLGSSSYS